jgi:hypothetical protein
VRRVTEIIYRLVKRFLFLLQLTDSNAMYALVLIPSRVHRKGAGGIVVASAGGKMHLMLLTNSLILTQIQVE